MSLSTFSDPGEAHIQPPKRKKNIGLTALIDVVFILLMFFMLTSSFIRQQSVSLPIPQASQTSANNSENVVLLIKNDGQFRLSSPSEKQPQEVGQLQPLLPELQRLTSEQPLLLLSEAEVSLQQLVNVMEQLQSQNITAMYIRALEEARP